MSAMASEVASGTDVSDNESVAIDEEPEDRSAIRDDLKSMTFEEIMRLKEELGAKIYKEAILGVETRRKRNSRHNKEDFKRLNKNRPREAPTNRPVPFLGVELRKSKKLDKELRDPRFDENAGTYNTQQFKENYKFLNKIRSNEIKNLKKQIDSASDNVVRQNLRKEMQKLINKNLEDQKWRVRQNDLKEELEQIRKAKEAGKTPHYTTKKERRAKELVKQFEELKQKGKLNKHLEKRRKKLTAKDRKKISFD